MVITIKMANGGTLALRCPKVHWAATWPEIRRATSDNMVDPSIHWSIDASTTIDNDRWTSMNVDEHRPCFHICLAEPNFPIPAIIYSIILLYIQRLLYSSIIQWSPGKSVHDIYRYVLPCPGNFLFRNYFPSNSYFISHATTMHTLSMPNKSIQFDLTWVSTFYLLFSYSSSGFFLLLLLVVVVVIVELQKNRQINIMFLVEFS